MKTHGNRLFFCQTIQETVALYFLLPIRTLSLSHRKTIFERCKKKRFLALDYSSERAFVKGLDEILSQIPSFLYHEIDNIAFSAFLNRLNSVSTNHIITIRELIYFTKSSFNPFFMAALDDYPPVRVLKLVFYLSLLFKRDFHEENVLYDTRFFDFSYRYFFRGDSLYLIGPVMTDALFFEDEKRLSYIKQIKNAFSLNLHTYELLNMLNQRNVMQEVLFTSMAKEIKKVFNVALQCYVEKEYHKADLRRAATHFIAQSSAKKISKISANVTQNEKFSKVLSRIRNNQVLRDLEALEWFNDLIFQKLSFETAGDPLKETVLKYLQKKLQADGYILCRFDHYRERVSLMEISPSFSEVLQKRVLASLDALNADRKNLHNSFTYAVIRDYTEFKNPIKLVEDLEKSGHTFCVERGVGSVLSIPLVFDKRVFAVLHFLSSPKYKFDEIDKRFLLKLSSALSKRYIENNLNSCIDRTVSLLEGLSKTIEHSYLKEKTDEVCENIAKAFCCDGAIIWFNKKEVFQTSKEVNELSILSEINFLDDQERKEEAPYTIGSEVGDSLISQNEDKDVVAVVDIEQECSDKRNDNCFMKYKKDFVSKGVTSIMFVPIKNYEGKLSGAVMIFDKTTRKYSALSQRMLKRIAVYIGSILNTVTYAKFRDQRLDESILHESSQYMNIIKGRALDLEYRVQQFQLPDSFDKHRLFLNIEDIKDFTSFMRSYLFAIFRNDRFSVPKYDELLRKYIKEIRQNSSYTSLRKSLNQVLAVHTSKMHQLRKMSYKNQVQHNFEVKIPSQYLHDVLSNMVNNAIKYGKPGSYIKITDSYNPPYYYNIHIQNIGYQIRREEQEIIFKKGARGYITKSLLKDKEEFQQSMSENKGLGLYLAKGVIKGGLDGNVVLQESIPEANTLFGKHTFVIKLPIEKIRKVR